MAIQQHKEEAEKRYNKVWKEVKFKNVDLLSEEREDDEEDPKEK